MNDEIDVSEGNEDGYGTRFTNRACFDVRISGETYSELKEIAETQGVGEEEALFRVIREGFDV